MEEHDQGRGAAEVSVADAVDCWMECDSCGNLFYPLNGMNVCQPCWTRFGSGAEYGSPDALRARYCPATPAIDLDDREALRTIRDEATRKARRQWPYMADQDAEERLTRAYLALADAVDTLDALLVRDAHDSP